MHELGIVIKVVKTVEDYANKNNVTKIETLVLQIGELSSVIPHYVQECFPIAVKDTLLADTQLEIEKLPAHGRCKSCGKVFNVIEHKSTCPACNSKAPEMISGNEFLIKEIVAC